MKPYYEHNGIQIWHGDCRDILPQLPKVDLVLTDPPYGTGQNPHRDPQARTKLAATKFYGSWEWDRKIEQELLNIVLKAGLMQILWGGATSMPIGCLHRRLGWYGTKTMLVRLLVIAS